MTAPPLLVGIAATVVGALLVLVSAFVTIDVLDFSGGSQPSEFDNYVNLAAQWVGGGAGILFVAGLFMLSWTALSAGSE